MARDKKKAAPGTERPVDALKHKDARTNIPTRELRDFVKDDESAPKVVRYDRDPTLDPQLVWKGKDEQDTKPLEVPAVPIYIQEKIHPQAIVEQVRKAVRSDGKEEPLGLFADFNGIEDFSKKVDFYHHAQHWSNRMILGDSLLVMTSLAEKEGLKGKVQCIYFDPPYGIKFGSNWQVSTRKRDVKDGKVEDASRQPEQVKAFRDTWELGIHSYLTYLRDRLVLVRELLAVTGSVFVQIGDENLHLVRSIADEVFGAANAIAVITFVKTTGASSPTAGTNSLAGVADFVLWYAKDGEQVRYRQLFRPKQEDEALSWIAGADGLRTRMASGEPKGGSDHKRFTLGDMTSQTVRQAATTVFPVRFGGREYVPGGTRGWATSPAGVSRLIAVGRVEASSDSLRFVRYHDDFPVAPINNVWTDTIVGQFTDTKMYVVQTASKVAQRCILMATDPGDLVLDPTCGSGTTAYVAEQWGRRWITIDTSRVALALARTRLMGAKYPYYILADSEEGLRKEAGLSGRTIAGGSTTNDVRRGFVYERVPHVTLKSIANNPEIREGMSRKEIDEAIARHAETETLVDRPYEDPRRVRVAGPFTVESLSPHRVLPADTERPASEGESRAEGVSFAAMIIDNLRKAGIKGTTKGQRLTFDRLEPRAGLWIHGEGEALDMDGKHRRIAVAIGPEHGTVGPEFVKEAAKEAVRGVGYDLLVVCGFAFDPHVAEETKEYGRLRVLVARMNPDLAMGDSLLKKTGAGNLFMVFGEPDVEIRKQQDGMLVAEVRGVDVYDPTSLIDSRGS